MIAPLKPSEKACGEFVVADIETYAKPHPREGDLIIVDTAWRENDGSITHVKHRTWAGWWSWLKTKSRNDKKFRKIYAHNGGGFDWVCLAEWLLTDGREEYETITNIQAGSKMIVLAVAVGKKFTIRFTDSLPLLRAKLDDLGWKFLGRRKKDIGGKMPHEILAENPALFNEYVEEDTEILLGVLEKTLEVIREKVAKISTLGFTIGATALNVFKTVGLTQPITTPWQDDLKTFLRAGFTGGRVEVFKHGVFGGVSVYDINSLYPSVMVSERVPTSDRVIWLGEGAEFDPKAVGIYEIEWSQNPASGLPVLCQKGKGCYSGRGIFYSPELILLKEVDPQCPIMIKRGAVFLDADKVFGPFVSRLYTLRLSDYKGPLGEICKYLLNSLYGKTAQHSTRSKLCVVKDQIQLVDMVRSESVRPRTINAELGVYEVSEDLKCEHEHVGIAGIITSAARVSLYRGLLATGADNVLYCDTDSVHTLGTLPASLCQSESGRELGLFKPEFKGEAVYAGKKLYALRLRSADGKHTDKIRAKGVSVGGSNGHRLTFDDLCAIAGGEKVRCTFYQPSTHREVFGGTKKAGVFQQRSRTLRLT